MNRKFLCNSNCVLREVLNKEENIDIVQDFIETILDIEIIKINIIRKLNSQDIFKPQRGLVEVQITTNKNKKFLVGIQIIDGFYIQNKMILYHAQLRSNEELFSSISKTITINIIDTEYYKTANFDQIIKVKDQNEEVEEKMGEIHLLELPKFKKNQNYTKENDWISYLKGDNLSPRYEKVIKLDDELDKYWQNEEL